MLTITALITDKCNRRCQYCIGKCNEIDGVSVLDFDMLMQWVTKFAPRCNLHISGGEPLMVDGVSEMVSKAIHKGHNVTMFTNGDLIKENAELVEMPIVWHVTHHAPTSVDVFLENIEPIRSKQNIITRLRHGKEALNNREYLEHSYADYNFHWSVCNSARIIDNQEHSCDINHVASAAIHMIDHDGTVYPCSTKKYGKIGNVYDMTYDKKAAIVHDAIALECVRSNKCSAFQSAILAERLHRELEAR